MTVKAPYRAHQTSTTTSTGTLTLIAAATQYENFSTYYATGKTATFVTTDNANNYEITSGVLTIGGSDTLSRVSVIKSTTGSLISWGVGTKDVFSFEGASAEYDIAISGNKTVDITDWGNVYHYTGGAGATFTLPALSVVPLGFTVGLSVAAASTLALACNAADTFLNYSGLTQYLGGNANVKLIATATGWLCFGTVGGNAAARVFKWNNFT